MGTKGSIRAFAANMRRIERDEKKRHKELAKLEKERLKLSALEQARLEVDTYENQLAVLLSVHKEACEEWDWIGFAAALPEPPARAVFRDEIRATQNALVAHPDAKQAANLIAAKARSRDIQMLQDAVTSHAAAEAAMEGLRALAQRILLGESMAFIEAFAELNPVAEISAVGSLRTFSVASESLIECVFKASANDVIPSQVKSLTAGGKVSSRAMARSQRHELYQDYICGCVLRLAREVFAMLPVKMVLITALADVYDSTTGQIGEHPVLSVAMDKETIMGINYGNLDTMEAISHFQHRGNFQASRKSGAFQPIAPLSVEDLSNSKHQTPGFDQLCSSVTRLLEIIRIESSQLAADTGVRADVEKGIR